MKNKKTTILVLSILLVITILFLVALFLKDYITFKEPNIPEDETIQIATLKGIYTEILKGENLEKNATVSFDESALKNLVTKEKFSDKGTEELNSILENYKGTEKQYVISVTYAGGILKTSFKEYIALDEPFCITEVVTKYKLKVKNGAITYSQHGDQLNILSQPASEPKK